MHGVSLKYSLMMLMAALAAPAVAAPVVLLDDSFADGERTTQTLPGSAQWFGASSATPITVTDQKLVLPAPVTREAAMAFFASSSSPVTLGVGDSLTMSFKITTPASGGQTGDNSFFYGFLASGADRPTADGDFNHSRHANDAGYFAVSPLAYATNLRNKIVQRVPGINNLTSAGTGDGSLGGFSQLGATAGIPNLTAGGTYTYSLLMVRDSETQITLTSNMGGVTLSRTDDATVGTTGIATSFDTLFIYSGSNPQITIDDVRVEYSQIPEPASLGLLGLGLAMFGSRRRR